MIQLSHSATMTMVFAVLVTFCIISETPNSAVFAQWRGQNWRSSSSNRGQVMAGGRRGSWGGGWIDAEEADEWSDEMEDWGGLARTRSVLSDNGGWMHMMRALMALARMWQPKMGAEPQQEGQENEQNRPQQQEPAESQPEQQTQQQIEEEPSSQQNTTPSYEQTPFPRQGNSSPEALSTQQTPDIQQQMPLSEQTQSGSPLARQTSPYLLPDDSAGNFINTQVDSTHMSQKAMSNRWPANQGSQNTFPTGSVEGQGPISIESGSEISRSSSATTIPITTTEVIDLNMSVDDDIRPTGGFALRMWLCDQQGGACAYQCENPSDSINTVDCGSGPGGKLYCCDQ